MKNAYSKEETLSKELLVECRGKTIFTQNSAKWDKERGEVYETTKVYQLRNNWPTRNREKSWYIDDGNIVWFPENGDDPKQPGHPHWYRNISVTNTEISFSKSGYNDFDKNKPLSDGLNQKNEYQGQLTINRISGEWEDVNTNTTYWNDGSWLTTRWHTTGSCKKGEKKF